MAEAHSKQHDYHIVEPSPWPLVGSISAFVLAIGAIAWMRTGQGGLFGVEGPWMFFAGLLGVLATMIGWWRVVVRESTVERAHTPVVQLHLRYGMILFIASEVMFFVAWFWAYFDAALFPAAETITGDQLIGLTARQEATGGQWPPAATGDGRFVATFDPWGLPLVNTLILLLSGTTVTWAHHALLQNDRRGLTQALVLTVLLGLTFTSLQAYEYMHAAFEFSGHIYGSVFFMATGFHGAHVIIGTIFLAVILARAVAGHLSPEKHFGFEAAAWYWHFVDVVWLFLFASIYIWGAGASGAH